MKHPFVGFASDSSILTPGRGVPHPRGYGNNARVLGEYVRQKKVLTLAEAIRKMTSLPARHFRFAGRGLVKEGFAADLVVFDPETVTDRATFDQPHAFAAGLPHVVVNGIPVVRGSEPTHATPGQALAREDQSSSIAK
jgi:N-acyl-D-amino-acid deacylase